jgi:hypothetical protein
MSCCRSLFVNLGGGGGTIADGVLQTPTALTSSLQIVIDNLGNSSPLQLSTTQVGFTYGLFKTGVLEIYGTTQDVQFWTANGGTRNGYITVGASTYELIYQKNAPMIFGTNNAEKMRLDGAGNLIVGGATAGARGHFVGDGTNPIARFDNSSNVLKGSISNAGLFTMVNFITENLTSGTLQTARTMRIGDKGSITDAGLFALGLTAQIAVEHNGNIYYLPCSTSLIS